MLTDANRRATDQKYLNSFHTGFNLQALRYFFNENYCTFYQDQYNLGVNYYREHFFLTDGTPKYWDNCTWPVDIHAPAQAIVFFSGEGPKYRELTDRILNWMCANMYSGDGYFYFRKTKTRTNKISYMRWTQAWALHALTEYGLHNQGQTSNFERALNRPSSTV